MRRRRHETRGRVIFPLFVALAMGGVGGWILRDWEPDRLPRPDSPPTPIVVPPAVERRSEATPVPEPPEPSIGADPIAELRRHGLRLPLDGIEVEVMKNSFVERRDRGGRPHEAADLMAPRMTPVYAVESGRIAKLFLSEAGGTTIYQFDPSERYCYYYAHLQQYAAGLREGHTVSAGELIGYVGSTGNAAPDAPHLHFAIFKLTDAERWWDGTAIDPYLVFMK